MPHSDDTHSTRTALLAQLGSLTAMARGTLAEEVRERTAPDGSGSIRLGPYFKHQVWADGRNQSARVPAPCVDQLREHLQNGERFDQLTDQLAALAIDEGRAQRAALAPKPVDPARASAKKNSKKNA